MLDRTQAPSFVNLKPFHLIKPLSFKNDGGLISFLLQDGTQEVTRIEFCFPAGKWYEPYNGLSQYLAKLIGEGTKTKTPNEVHELMAQYGSFFESVAGNHQITVTIYCLSRYVQEMVDLLVEMVEEPRFALEDFEKAQKQFLQTHQVGLNKTSYLASQAFSKMMFNDKHPYSHVLDEIAIKAVTLEDVKKYHTHILHWNQASVFVSGSGNKLESTLKTLLQKKNIPGPRLAVPSFKNASVVGQNVQVSKEGALQGTIRAGLFIPNRDDKRYAAIYVYNEILGGYFGSRLMQNIREDKGYTYGIGTGLVSDKFASYFVCQTDVGVENIENTLTEVKYEMSKLQNELVSQEELQVVKNYIIGSFGSSLGTPFSFMDKAKAVHFSDLEVDYYEQFMQEIIEVSAEEIQQVAQSLFKPEELNIVVAG